MLDLTVICGSLYEIKLLDGTVLKLKRPTQEMYETILSLSKSVKKMEDGDMGIIDAVMEVFAAILNRNDKGIKFTKEQLADDYDFMVAMTVMGDYMKFYSEEIKSKVDFQVVQ